MVNKLFNLKEWWNEVGNLDNLLEKKVQVMVRLLLPAILVHEEVKLLKIFIFYSTDEFLYK